MIKPYRGRRSFLVLDRTGLRIRTWREGDDLLRLPAIRELAHRLQAAGIQAACGPVLSGALFAQTISDYSELSASYLRKPGYAPEQHTINYLPSKGVSWVFVDDAIHSGKSMCRAAKEIRHPPKAIIVFDAYGWNAEFPKKWDAVSVPAFMLRGRKRSL